MGAASCQPQGFRCIHTGARRKMHTHWLHVYRCSQTRLKAYRCPPSRLQVQTCRWPQARLQVHRCPQTWLRARRPGSRCNHAGTRRPVSRCKLAGARYPYGLRVRVYVPPTSDTTQPMGSGHPSKGHSQCRPGPKSGVISWLKIFLTATLFTKTHSVRVPALSAGAGGSSTFVHAVSQQVLTQAEIQSFIGIQVLLTPFLANCQTLPRVSLSQTWRSFRFLQIPDECLAADHRYLVPNADRKLAAATYPILGWDGPHWVPAPRMLRDVVWILTPASLQVMCGGKLCSGDALRPDLPWVLKAVE